MSQQGTKTFFDYESLEFLRRTHPAWRLLQADHAALIISFFYRTFVQPNLRGVSQTEIISLLEDELYRLRQFRGEDSFPRSAKEYLDEWAEDHRGWLRKYYLSGSDLLFYDLTPGA